MPSVTLNDLCILVCQKMDRLFRRRSVFAVKDSGLPNLFVKDKYKSIAPSCIQAY